MPLVNVDTHVLVFALAGKVRPKERRVLSSHEWGISAIVLWELAKLVQLRRIDVDLEAADVRLALGGLHVWPLDLDVARASTSLDFRGDPADELIAATSVVHRVPLLTRDRQILASRVVPFAA